MDFVQLIRILVILAIIAGLDAIVYLIALSFNIYYRRKISVLSIFGKNILKNMASPRLRKKSETKPAENTETHNTYGQQTLPGVEIADVKPDPVPDKSFQQKFRIDDRVELFNSRGEITGRIISCNDNNSKSEYRHLVNWGKNGIWWVSEDQIEHADYKGVEVNV